MGIERDAQKLAVARGSSGRFERIYISCVNCVSIYTVSYRKVDVMHEITVRAALLAFVC